MSVAAAAASALPAADREIEARTMRRVFWRLMPFLLFAYLICYIDRVNVGFASLQMNKALGLDPKIYGLGAGIFFIGYFFLEVPSNLALERFGARTWIARIMITWGLISGGMAFIGGSTSFLVMRVLLGAAEAGFFPGVILYLTYWFPAEHRARIVGIFMVGIPAAGLLGSPLSGAILSLDGVLGLGGWQWVFLLEAAPAVLGGVLAFLWLTDRPQQAAWLAPAERDWLGAKLDAERRRQTAISHVSMWQVLGNRYVLTLALIYSGAAGASSALALWQPQILKSFGLTNFETGLVNAIPYGIAAVLMVLWGRRSDRTGERVWHNALPLGWIVIALLCTLFVSQSQLWVMVALLTVVLVGTYACKGPFWALSSEMLGPAAAAAGLAQINALGNLAGFVTNYLLGWIKEETGSFAVSLMPIVVLSAAGMLAVLLIGRGRPRTVAVTA
ncbi:MAG: MFS transporter [Alphaproteobacteria bacterium]|nr:MFS transporter [Alphaproteobacteria bacterium]